MKISKNLLFQHRLCYLLTGLILVVAPALSAQSSKNGFDLTGALVPLKEILQGGPPKDGIPAIDHPRFVDAKADHQLKPDDRILGLVLEGVARAYPIRILNWHEVVNDTIGDHSIVVTFCPLCGTGIVFEAPVARGDSLTFGVSGLLYNSDVLLYDRQTNSLWSQISREAISGPYKGTRLKQIPAQHTSWLNWQQQYPKTKVLSFDTGFPRDYTRNPYRGYERDERLYFPVSTPSNRFDYHPKESVIGLELGGHFKAYPFIELEKQGLTSFEDHVGNETVIIKWEPAHRSGQIFDRQGKEIATIISFWFAWLAFHPKTEVFQSQ